MNKFGKNSSISQGVGGSRILTIDLDEMNNSLSGDKKISSHLLNNSLEEIENKIALLLIYHWMENSSTQDIGMEVLKPSFGYYSIEGSTYLESLFTVIFRQSEKVGLISPSNVE